MDTSSKELKVRIRELGLFVAERIYSGQKVKMRVVGDSMNPMLISERDNVTLAPIKKLKKGQVVFYKSGDSYLLHRIIAMKHNLVFCMGDNGAVLEPPVNVEDIIAVVTDFERDGIHYSVKNKSYKFYAYMWRMHIKWRPRMLKMAVKKNAKKQ